MEMFQNYDEDNLMSKILFLYFSFMHGAIGVFLFFNDLKEYNSRVFAAMGDILPMKFWGLVFLLAAACFVLASIQELRKKYMYMLIAGLAGAIVFGLFSMASLELSKDQTNTINYMIICSIDLVIALVGGAILWIRRN